MPNGQFGTRAQGGKNSASPRYIHTALNPITRKLFIEDDEHVVDYNDDDGTLVEPKFYVPIIPLVLVNGADGIGTGWSTFIPNHNPREITENLKRKLNGGNFYPMKPFYKNFKGSIEKVENMNSYKVSGEYEVVLNNNLIKITELPIRKWTSNYKKFLEGLMMQENPIIFDLKEYHTTDTVDFELKVKESSLADLYQNDKI